LRLRYPICYFSSTISLILSCFSLVAGGRVIDPFREKALCLLIWRAWLVGLLAAVLVVTRSLDIGLALRIGGGAALGFSLALVLFATWLTDSRVAQVEPWRSLEPGERPAGAPGLRWARGHLKRLVLQFAKAASAVAVALLGSALVLVHG
jgi:hypothetical protein